MISLRFMEFTVLSDENYDLQNLEAVLSVVQKLS